MCTPLGALHTARAGAPERSRRYASKWLPKRYIIMASVGHVNRCDVHRPPKLLGRSAKSFAQSSKQQPATFGHIQSIKLNRVFDFVCPSITDRSVERWRWLAFVHTKLCQLEARSSGVRFRSAMRGPLNSKSMSPRGCQMMNTMWLAVKKPGDCRRSTCND